MEAIGLAVELSLTLNEVSGASLSLACFSVVVVLIIEGALLTVDGSKAW
jgi:hypothetical protein